MLPGKKQALFKDIEKDYLEVLAAFNAYRSENNVTIRRMHDALLDLSHTLKSCARIEDWMDYPSLEYVYIYGPVAAVLRDVSEDVAFHLFGRSWEWR